MEQKANMGETAEAARQLATTHYAKSDEPLYLAAVGQALRGERLWPIEGESRSLKDWLKTLEPHLYVLQDEIKPARIAIATPERKEDVQKIFQGLQHADLLNTLARPILIAFCVQGNDNNPVYVTKRPPFRYTLVEPDDRTNYHVIPSNLRLPGLKFTSIARMNPDEVASLGDRIQQWAEQTGVALDTMTQATAEAATSAPEEVAVGTMSALDRLIAAQRQDLRDRLVIPADIAALLSRHR
ncbi:hypothetical protein [Komagataeibacter melaceti]|uniref:hypothetical protein n=1 Tax=Komagataeibacter melaceti TaxID=2766577 RepID=UPI0011E5B28E|nr:hypothetical protein [Komagataeibacter melaceti]